MAVSLLRQVHGVGRIFISSRSVAAGHIQSSNVPIVGVAQSTFPLLTPSSSLLFQNLGHEQRRNYAMRQELREHGIVWRRPEYIPSWKPEKSGDLKILDKTDKTRPISKVMAAKAIFEEADEVTKKLLSVEFAPYKESLKVMRQDALKKVQRHKYDKGSMECAIAMMTIKIRSMQQYMLENKKDIRKKCELNELIAFRKRQLKHLRRMDYKRFEWLLEQLNILYRPFPENIHQITRKGSIRKLARMHSDDAKRVKLDEYKKVLEAQKEAFLKEKDATLKWIAKTEAELGLPNAGKTNAKL